MDRFFKVDGTICTEDDNADQLEVLSAFIEFVESKGWVFIGTLGEKNEDGEYIGG